MWPPHSSPSLTNFMAERRIPRLHWCATARVNLPRSSSTWAGTMPPGWRGIGSQSSMATASQPVSIASKNRVQPRGVPGPAHRWWSMSRPRGEAPMSSPVKTAMRRNARCLGPSSRRWRPASCGWKTAIFVPATFSVTLTIWAPAASAAHSRGSLWRFEALCARVAARPQVKWPSSACGGWTGKAPSLSFVVCVSSCTKRPETGRR